MTRSELARRLQEQAPWFYDFDLGGGLHTVSKLDPASAAVHTTRRRMVRRAVREHFHDRLDQICAIDIGCHEGYFSVMLALEGVPEVLGVDLRVKNVEKAALIAEALKLEQLRFEVADCESLTDSVTGPFELTLCLGLLYHLENPIRCLRQMARLTRELLIVETQVIDPVGGETEWGRQDRTRPYRGAFALIDESSALARNSDEAGATPLALCPSLEAVQTALRAVGFARIERLEPPADAYEQFRRGKRVVLAACKP